MIRSTSLQHDAIGVFFSSLFAFLLLLPLLISKLTLNTIPRAAAATVGVFAPRASGTRKDGDHGMLLLPERQLKKKHFFIHVFVSMLLLMDSVKPFLLLPTVSCGSTRRVRSRDG
ncbi:hypothetical protein Zmor_024893 [Zophobas morio]|uniref:Uncharacterized protein n=1 Tax=Zophobas morio TaxID=2755281 RepID=A0AA38HQD6_9CUCU|nr:hypothetical protein Zmor_024893 [Zophobas morio]